MNLKERQSRHWTSITWRKPKEFGTVFINKRLGLLAATQGSPLAPMLFQTTLHLPSCLYLDVNTEVLAHCSSRSMDHLDHLFDHGEVSIRPQIKIPYVCNDQYTYDGGDFKTYPQRCGFDIERIMKSDFDGRDRADVAPFLQAWLWFGTLRDVFAVSGIQIIEQSFIVFERRPKEEANVSTANLNERIWDWVAAETGHVESGKLERLDRVDETLRFAEQVLEAIVWEEGYGGKRSIYTDRNQSCIDQFSRGELVVMSIAILGEALSKAKHFVFGDNIWGEGRQLRWEANGVLLDLLASAGWCPGEISALDATYDSESRISNLYYLCFQPRQKNGKDHSWCSKIQCLANQINEAEYVTRHIEICRDCEFLTVEQQDALSMSSILLSDGTPLISVAKPPGNQTAKVQLHHSGHRRSQPRWARHPLLKARAYSRNASQYVAFSHVWSDGLGNPKSNSLPQCQLLRLQELANRTSEHSSETCIPFWIDTMCVPLRPDIRRLAIHRMAESYRQAAKVIVLDSTIIATSPDCSLLKKLSMIENSDWNHRLWTFQEGVLARNLGFQMSQDCIGFSDLMQQYKHHFRPCRSPVNVDNLKRRYVIHNDPYALKILQAIATWDDDTDDWLVNLSAAEDFTTRSDPMLGYKANFWEVRDIVDSVLADCYRRVLRIKLMDNPDIEAIHHFNPNRLVNRIRSVFRLRPRSTFVDEVNKVCSMLRFRLTSKLMDEPICLANLLGLDVSLVSKHNTPETRMVALYRLLKNDIPVGLVFLNTTKLQIYGFRWAPASFLDKGGKVSYEPHSFLLEHRARICPSGLKLSAPGLLLDAAQAEKLPEHPEMVFTCPGQIACHSAQLSIPEGSGQRPNWTKFKQKSLALIFDRHQKAIENIADLKKKGEWTKKQFSLMTGGVALLSIQATKGRAFHATYEASALATALPGAAMPAQQAFSMTLLPYSQCWIVA